MIRHVSIFKFKPDFDPVKKAEWASGLDELEGQTEGLLSLSHGPDAYGHDDLVLSPHHDYAVVIDFSDMDAVRAYATNERHLELAQISKPNSTSITTVDFKLP